MSAVGLSMAAIFGVIFVGLGLYLLIDRMRTGELFRQEYVTYAAFGAGILAVAGILILSAT